MENPFYVRILEVFSKKGVNTIDKENQKKNRFLAVGVILVALVSFIFLLWSKGWVIPNAMSASGYKGKETFIDLNVFNGNQAEFEKY